MDTKYRLLQFDYWIQTILGVVILVCCVTVYGIYFGILGLIFFGALQVISGLVFSIIYKDKKRSVYLFIVVLFFLIWYIAYSTSNGYSSPINFFSGLLCLVPPTLGIWYYRLTKAEFKASKNQQEEVGFNDEEILDA